MYKCIHIHVLMSLANMYITSCKSCHYIYMASGIYQNVYVLGCTWDTDFSPTLFSILSVIIIDLESFKIFFLNYSNLPSTTTSAYHASSATKLDAFWNIPISSWTKSCISTHFTFHFYISMGLDYSYLETTTDRF